MRVRVAFDRQIFCLQRTGGISRYFVELIRALPSAGVAPVLPFHWVANEPAVAGLPVMRDLLSVRAGRAALAADALRARRRGAPSDVELVHRTFYDPRFLPRQGERTPALARPVTAVTVYDMIPELFPESVPEGVHLAKERYVHEADVVLTISDATRRDVVARYADLRAPVVTTPLGVSDRFRPGGRPVRGLPPHYLLYVGRRGGYKDYAVALTAFAELASGNPDLHLVCVGGGPWSGTESVALDRLADRVHRLDLTDAELARAYAHAAVFVFPSRYEGFGLPMLEAMACGAPVVAADAASLPEVGGDAAHYFPPGDPAALAHRLAEVLDDPELRTRSVALGLARAGEYTWQRTAQLTAAAYRRATAAGANC